MNESQSIQFGKYRIESELGRGAFGTVYRAIDSSLSRPVALKILEPMLMRDKVWVSRFREEARTMARLDHPNVVPIFEIDEVTGQLFIAMKLIGGNNLAKIISSGGRLEWTRIHSLVLQMASALDYAYAQKVVHRDLKPANVLMDGEQALLTDFGFAKIVGDNSQSITISGGIVGTPAYIAPEVWEGKEQKPATQMPDIYALGCILYEMVTGEVLFQGDSVPSIMMKHFRPPPLTEKLPDDVPPGVLGVINKALARDPQERFTSAGEMVQALVQGEPADVPDDFAQQLKGRAETAISRGDLVAAQSFVTSLVEIFPDDPQVPALQERLAQAIQEEQRQKPIEPKVEDPKLPQEHIKAPVPEKPPEPEPIEPPSKKDGKRTSRQGLIILAITIVLICFVCFCLLLLGGNF